MRKTVIVLLFALCLPLGLALQGCKSTLETGGAYAQTNAVPDKAFYVVDAAFDLAYSSIDAVFKFEYDNRAMLWKASPDIKHTIDKVRVEALTVRNQYVAARAVYIANPVPAGLTTLQNILAHIQQLAVTATSILPKP